MPPLAGPRAIQVSRTLGALARFGWPSTVIAVDPTPGGPLLRDSVGAPAFAADGVEIARVPSAEESTLYRAAVRALPSLARPDRQRPWIIPATREALRRLGEGTYERLVTFAQPWSDHLVGLNLRRVVSLPWIAHFSDPWADSPYLPDRARARQVAAQLEADVIREADAIVFVTAQTADVTMRKYADEYRRKVEIIPHGFDGGMRKLAPAIRPKHARLRLLYTGRFYDGLRTPDALFAALQQLSAGRPLASELEVVMVGPLMERYQTAIRAHGLEAFVAGRPGVPYQDAMRLAAAADVLLVIDADAAGASLFLPSKLVDYLVWRVPILGITPPAGASADLLRRLGCPVAAPNDPAAIAHAISALLDDWHAGRLEVSPSFDAVAADYDIDHTARMFAAVLERCH